MILGTMAACGAEQTGVNLEFIAVDDTAMQLLFTDGDLPDIVIWDLDRFLKVSIMRYVTHPVWVSEVTGLNGRF